MRATRDTERIRKLQDREAPRYDHQIAVCEQILFGDGRRWVCEQARGPVLERSSGHRGTRQRAQARSLVLIAYALTRVCGLKPLA